MSLAYLRGPILCAALWLAAGTAGAEVYKCVSPEGKTTYGDSPCAKGTREAANISAEVGACANSECEAQRAEQAAVARQRLKEEKEALSEMTQQRRRAEAEYAQERARLLQAQRLASVEQKVDALLVQGSESLYPAYPIFPTWPPCRGTYCVGRRMPSIALPGPLPPSWPIAKLLPAKQTRAGGGFVSSPHPPQP